MKNGLTAFCRRLMVFIVLYGVFGPLTNQCYCATPGLIGIGSTPSGLKLNLNWDGDAYANVHGGLKRGYATDSVLSFGLGLNTAKAGGWQGGYFQFGLRTIASTHPSNYAGDLQGLSNLAAPNLHQVDNFWYRQKIGHHGLLRMGIMDLNNYFDVTESALLFPNASFGISPTLTSDVPTDTYPFSSWGIMGRFGSAHNNWKFGIFQGLPTKRGTALRDGEMVLTERDWSDPIAGSRLAFGAWYRQSPATAYGPREDWGFYTNLEQALPNHPSIVAFLQLGESPKAVNLVPHYLGAGLNFEGLGHGIGSMGIGIARAWIRNQIPETSIETTVTVPVAHNTVTLQPDIQYILHPSGIYPNALMLGLRMHVTLF